MLTRSELKKIVQRAYDQAALETGSIDGLDAFGTSLVDIVEELEEEYIKARTPFNPETIKNGKIYQQRFEELIKELSSKWTISNVSTILRQSKPWRLTNETDVREFLIAVANRADEPTSFFGIGLKKPEVEKTLALFKELDEKESTPSDVTDVHAR